MKIVSSTSPDEFEVHLTREELVLLSNALNEVCNGIETWEFSTRPQSSVSASLRGLV
jgi:hypothetical protein